METSGGYVFESIVALLPSRSLGSKSNVLIDDDGHARLANFGLLTIISDEPTITSTVVGATMAYWMSPELLFPDKFGLKETHPTKASDCYGLGMLVYEVLSGQTPFSQHPFFTVVMRILDGERPERPQGTQGVRFTDSIWAMLELCWKQQPCDRISAKDALLGLEGNPCPLRSSSRASGDGETNTDDRSDIISIDSVRFLRFVSGPSPIILVLCRTPDCGESSQRCGRTLKRAFQIYIPRHSFRTVGVWGIQEEQLKYPKMMLVTEGAGHEQRVTLPLFLPNFLWYP